MLTDTVADLKTEAVHFSKTVYVMSACVWYDMKSHVRRQRLKL
jgi:hypothetical protein